MDEKTLSKANDLKKRHDDLIRLHVSILAHNVIGNINNHFYVKSNVIEPIKHINSLVPDVVNMNNEDVAFLLDCITKRMTVVSNELIEL